MKSGFVDPGLERDIWLYEVCHGERNLFYGPRIGERHLVLWSQARREKYDFMDPAMEREILFPFMNCTGMNFF